MSRILIVDDEPSLNTLAAEYLTLAGHEIVQVYDAESALALLRQDRSFDAIVLDKRLPGMDGWELCRLLKADPQLKIIPVILLSASAHPDHSPEKVGAELFMAKPFSPKQLLAALRSLKNPKPA